MADGVSERVKNCPGRAVFSGIGEGLEPLFFTDDVSLLKLFGRAFQIFDDVDDAENEDDDEASCSR